MLCMSSAVVWIMNTAMPEFSRKKMEIVFKDLTGRNMSSVWVLQLLHWNMMLRISNIPSFRPPVNADSTSTDRMITRGVAMDITATYKNCRLLLHYCVSHISWTAVEELQSLGKHSESSVTYGAQQTLEMWIILGRIMFQSRTFKKWEPSSGSATPVCARSMTWLEDPLPWFRPA